ncbi:hypothetical protein Dimus_004236 [Dionaea muscipula]
MSMGLEYSMKFRPGSGLAQSGHGIGGKIFRTDHANSIKHRLSASPKQLAAITMISSENFPTNTMTAKANGTDPHLESSPSNNAQNYLEELDRKYEENQQRINEINDTIKTLQRKLDSGERVLRRVNQGLEALQATEYCETQNPHGSFLMEKNSLEKIHKLIRKHVIRESQAQGLPLHGLPLSLTRPPPPLEPPRQQQPPYVPPRKPEIRNLDHVLIGDCSMPIVKILTATDADDSQGRLLLSKKDVDEQLKPMLRENELLTNGIPVVVYDADKNNHSFTFIAWNHGTMNVLTKGWNKFRTQHRLEEYKDEVTVWMFRRNDIPGGLFFAIIPRRLETIVAKDKMKPRKKK